MDAATDAVEGRRMKAVLLKAFGQSLWAIIVFIIALTTKTTYSIVGLGILAILYSFGFGLARQIIDEVKDDER